MKQGLYKTEGILLKRIPITNGKTLLEFFTPDFGRVLVGAKGVNTNKKIKHDLDVFRRLQLELFRGRSSWTLKSINTLELYDGFLTTYKASTNGHKWLSDLQKTVPEEVECPQFYSAICNHFSGYCDSLELSCQLYFEVQLLQFSGMCPHWESPEKSIETKTIQFMATTSYEAFMKIREHIPIAAIEKTRQFLGKHFLQDYR